MQLIDRLPRDANAVRVFSHDLTSDYVYRFWCTVREHARLRGVRIRDCRHTWASQGLIHGVGLPTVGRLLGHRNRRTTAIYAHLDDAALRDAAAQTALVIAEAMGFSAQSLVDDAPDKEPVDMLHDPDFNHEPQKHARNPEICTADNTPGARATAASAERKSVPNSPKGFVRI